MSVNLSEPELMALLDIAAGRDPYAACQVCGDYGRCLLTLAALRRAGLIDHHDRLTDVGRGMLTSDAA